MIDLYYWPTPNGRKISIMLEECRLDYNVVRCDIGAGDQFDPAFLKISPNNRMPAIVDQETGISVFEGGAILVYLPAYSLDFNPIEQVFAKLKAVLRKIAAYTLKGAAYSIEHLCKTIAACLDQISC